MDKESLLNKLSSKYIINIIQSYIDDENFLYKLITYSKFWQKRLDIQSIDYQNRFYINIMEFYKNIYYDSKNKTKENFEQFLLNYNVDKNIVGKIAVDYFKTRQNFETKKNISFDCPIFGELVNLENFDKIFTITANLNDFK